MSATDRSPRELESREAEYTDEYAYQPPSILPDPAPEGGFDFRWVRHSNLGEADARNMSYRTREGWVPVKAGEHPELLAGLSTSAGDDRVEPTEDDHIMVGDLILMKIDSRRARARQKYYSDLAAAQIDGANRDMLRDSDARMPLKVAENRSATRFGDGSPLSSKNEKVD